MQASYRAWRAAGAEIRAHQHLLELVRDVCRAVGNVHVPEDEDELRQSREQDRGQARAAGTPHAAHGPKPRTSPNPDAAIVGRDRGCEWPNRQAANAHCSEEDSLNPTGPLGSWAPLVRHEREVCITLGFSLPLSPAHGARACSSSRTHLQPLWSFAALPTPATRLDRVLPAASSTETASLAAVRGPRLIRGAQLAPQRPRLAPTDPLTRALPPPSLSPAVRPCARCYVSSCCCCAGSYVLQEVAHRSPWPSCPRPTHR